MTNFYITDRALNILGVIVTDGSNATPMLELEENDLLEGGSIILSGSVPAPEFDQFGQVISGYEDAQHIYRGNYILYENSKGESKFSTIMTTTFDSGHGVGTTDFTAEEAGMDLLNEIVAPFEAKQQYSASEYILRFTGDSGFKIGINEIGHLRRTLKWEGYETSFKRVQSVLTQFDNAELSFSFDIENMRIKNKYINIHKKRGKDTGETLYLDQEIDRINIVESIEDMATAMWATGGTSENKDVPITFANMDYKSPDGRYTSPKGDPRLYDNKANEVWSRYRNPDEQGGGKGFIVQYFSYDTTSELELFNRTMSALLDAKDVKYQITIDLAKLPDGLEVGDWVSTVSIGAKKYFKARVLNIIRSYTDPSDSKVILGNYIFLGSGMDSRLNELSNKVKAMRNGTDAVTGYLTSETVSLTAKSDGSVVDLSKAQGDFKVIKGSVEVSTDDIEYRVATENGCVATIDAGGKYKVNSVISDDATAVFEAEYNGLVVSKVLSLSKSIEGVQGIDGENGVDGKNGSDGKNGEDGVIAKPDTPLNPHEGQVWFAIGNNGEFIIKQYTKGLWKTLEVGDDSLAIKTLYAVNIFASRILGDNFDINSSSGYVSTSERFVGSGGKNIIGTTKLHKGVLELSTDDGFFDDRILAGRGDIQFISLYKNTNEKLSTSKYGAGGFKYKNDRSNQATNFNMREDGLEILPDDLNTGSFRNAKLKLSGRDRATLDFNSSVSFLKDYGARIVLDPATTTLDALSIITDKLVLRSDDNVNVRNRADTAWVSMRGAAYINASSRQFKRDFRRIDYTYADELKALNFYDYLRKDTGERQLGIVVEGSHDLPFIIRDGENSGVDTYSYATFALATLKFSLLQDEHRDKLIDNMCVEIDTLKAENAEMKAELKEIKLMLERTK